MFLCPDRCVWLVNNAAAFEGHCKGHRWRLIIGETRSIIQLKAPRACARVRPIAWLASRKSFRSAHFTLPFEFQKNSAPAFEKKSTKKFEETEMEINIFGDIFKFFKKHLFILEQIHQYVQCVPEIYLYLFLY